MNIRPSILCPVDFSDASAGAIRYAAAIATRFATRLIVLSVEDPLLTEAAHLSTGVLWDPDECKRGLADFAVRVLGAQSPAVAALEYDVAVGKPAPEILRVARERSCDLIVMSTRGLTKARKLFFGSTTERVLRETTRPVLITPPGDPGALSFDDAARLLRRVVVPVDLSPASRHQLSLAAGVASAAGVPLVLVHVIEPVRSQLAARLHLTGIEADRRAVAEDGLQALLGDLPPGGHAEALVAYGDPAEELAKVAHDRRAGLIIVGLHGSPLLGPRMGSVTYRLLCLSDTMVLALPPDRLPALSATALSTTVAATGR
jgi:nucleotide-binding universal stress UspA family protein